MRKLLSAFGVGIIVGIIATLWLTRSVSQPQVDAMATAPVLKEAQTSSDLKITPIYKKKKDNAARPVVKKYKHIIKRTLRKKAADDPKPVVQIMTAKPLQIKRSEIEISGYKSSRVFEFSYAISRVDIYAPCPADSIRNSLSVDFAAWYRDQHKAQKSKSFLGITQRDLIVGLSIFGITALAFTAAK